MAMNTLASSWKAKYLRLPPKYVQASIIISLGALLFGLDTGTIGPLTTMDQFAVTFGTLSSTMHGLVVSMILIPAALASMFTGHLANYAGRVKATATGSFIFGVGAAIECGSVAIPMLIAGRAIKGIGEGFFLSILVVYITEISPPESRGTLASFPQFATTLGILVGYFTCYGSVGISSSLSWRLPFALQSIIAFSFTASVLLFLPQSPRWLTARGQHEESIRVWEYLGVDTDKREKVDEIDDANKADQKVKTKDLLAIFAPDAWKRTVLGLFLMGMQQLTGIDGVLYYAPTLFQSAGLTSDTASFLASGISALLIFLITIVGVVYADKWGRKTSTVAGGVGQAVVMLIIGMLYATKSVHAAYGAGRWIVIICIYLFALTFSVTWGVTLRVYVSEVQTPKTRAGATSLSLSVNWIVNWIVAFTTPIFLAKSASGCYFLWGGAALVTAVVAGIWMPETRGKSLEEIDASFRKGRSDIVVSGTIEYHAEEEGIVSPARSEKDLKHSKDDGRVIVKGSPTSSSSVSLY